MLGNRIEEPRLVLDHIAIACRSLEEGVAYVHQALGIEVPAGGAHPVMGTHNNLMALGPDLFLEIISVDPDALPPDRPRWFGLDNFNTPPQLQTWVLATDSIHSILPVLPAAVGCPTSITRGNLSWLISVPDDGSMPYDGAFPTIIEWEEGSPAVRMKEFGCRLRTLEVEHPEADAINMALRGRLKDQRVQIRSGPMKKLTAEIETPSGLRVLT